MPRDRAARIVRRASPGRLSGFFTLGAARADLQKPPPDRFGRTIAELALPVLDCWSSPSTGYAAEPQALASFGVPEKLTWFCHGAREGTVTYWLCWVISLARELLANRRPGRLREPTTAPAVARNAGKVPSGARLRGDPRFRGRAALPGRCGGVFFDQRRFFGSRGQFHPPGCGKGDGRPPNEPNQGQARRIRASDIREGASMHRSAPELTSGPAGRGPIHPAETPVRPSRRRFSWSATARRCSKSSSRSGALRRATCRC